MKRLTGESLNRRIHSFFIGNFLISCIIAIGSPLLAKDLLDVKRDEAKTVYTIDSSDNNRNEEAGQTDRAWDMFKNMGMLMDKRQGTLTQTQPPTKSQSAPATGR